MFVSIIGLFKLTNARAKALAFQNLFLILQRSLGTKRFHFSRNVLMGGTKSLSKI